MILNLGCKEIVEPVKEKYATEFKGKVVLQNQSEHSNALIYVEKLNRGVSSDSSGNYVFKLNSIDAEYMGESKVIYFLNDYDKDSAMIYLEKGKVKLDTLDVDASGVIKTKEMKQIVLVEGCTDKNEYRVGDYVSLTLKLTNVSEKTIPITISNCNGSLNSIASLYNDKYDPFTLGGRHDIVVELTCYVLLKPGKYYEGKISARIIEYKKLIFDDYLVTSGFNIDGRLLNQFQSRFNEFTLLEWYQFHRGISPKYDRFPNKYKFPQIKIVQ